MVEEETARRIELLVKKRVDEELERRKDEIDQEVKRRVEAAKAEMEKELMLELEKRREQAREDERKREVNMLHRILLSVVAPNLHPVVRTPQKKTDQINRIYIIIPIISFILY